MGYVIAVILVLVLVAAFVTFLVLNATRKGGSAGPRDPGGEGHPAGIMAPDESPLGDTAEHSGEQRDGRTLAESGTGEGESDGGRRAPQPESERLADRPR